MGSGSTTSVGKSGPVITFKLIAAKIRDVVGVETGSLVDSS